MAGERKKKKLAVNPKEAEIVRLIYTWYLSGMGAKAIAQRLNQEGHLYRGKRWFKNRILDIIGDEAYAGSYYFNKKNRKTNRPKPKEEWVLIPVPLIVDDDTWARAPALKKERTPTPVDSTANPAVVGSKTLLTGLATCGLCDARMTVETAKGGQYTYYNCSNYFRRGKAECPGQRIPAETLERAILDHMATKLFTRERVKSILRGIYTEAKEMDKRNGGQRETLIQQVEAVRAKLERQYDAIETGAIDISLVAERIKDLKERRAQLEARLEELKSPKTIPLHYFKEDAIAAFQATIQELFLGGGDREMTKRYLKLFIDKIIINLPKVEIVGKTEAILATLENKTAVRTDGVLTAGGSWLPGTDSNCRPSG